MGKTSASSELIRKKLFEDKNFVHEYEELLPRYKIISDIIGERIRQDLTQEELADRIGTKKSNISRFESGNQNPSLDFLVRVAKALGKTVKIQLF